MLTYEAVLGHAVRLPVVERIQLIESLWDTLSADPLPAFSEEWLAELRQRSAEYDAGAVETISWDQIKSDALRRAGAAAPNASH